MAWREGDLILCLLWNDIIPTCYCLWWAVAASMEGAVRLRLLTLTVETLFKGVNMGTDNRPAKEIRIGQVKAQYLAGSRKESYQNLKKPFNNFAPDRNTYSELAEFS